METQTHIVKLPRRTGKAQITERSGFVVVELSFDKYGNLGDEAEVRTWLGTIFEKYEDDPRPVFMPHPATGELAMLT
jgi:hypothetical protein